MRLLGCQLVDCYSIDWRPFALVREQSGRGGRAIGCLGAATLSAEFTRATGRARGLKRHAPCSQSEGNGRTDVPQRDIGPRHSVENRWPPLGGLDSGVGCAAAAAPARHAVGRPGGRLPQARQEKRSLPQRPPLVGVVGRRPPCMGPHRAVAGHAMATGRFPHSSRRSVSVFLPKGTPRKTARAFFDALAPPLVTRPLALKNADFKAPADLLNPTMSRPLPWSALPTSAASSLAATRSCTSRALTPQSPARPSCAPSGVHALRVDRAPHGAVRRPPSRPVVGAPPSLAGLRLRR